MKKQDPLPSCDFDPKWISADEALKQISDQIDPVDQIEVLALRTCLGRIAATDILSQSNVPNHTNSAMDGYAIAGDDIPQSGSVLLKMIGTSMAGSRFDQRVHAGECVRIMTGAVMPDGTDTVVMQERIEIIGDRIEINDHEKSGSNVRYAGEDLKVGDIAIAKGTRISASHLGLAASLGYAELPVFRKPRVAFFSNGDELRSVGTELALGELYDSNRYTLFGMLTEMGMDIVDLGIVRDDKEAISNAFKQGAACADLIITSAGASVGEADYVKETLDELGQAHFWKVAIKPGRPLAFGRVENSVFFGLPGNPVSVMVTFQIFVRHALKKLSGELLIDPIRLKVPTLSKLRKRPGRMEYQRGILSTNERGETEVTVTGEQGSGILSSMGKANCFIILPVECDGVAAGELVEVQPYH